MAADLVAQKVVSETGDDTLLLTYFLQIGDVLPKKGRGTALHKANTKRTAAAVLGVEASEVPRTIDGSRRLVMDLSFPERGFKRKVFSTNSLRVKAVVDAYAAVGRSDASDALRCKLAEIEDGISRCDAEVAQISTSSGSHVLRQKLQQELGLDCSVVLKRDGSGRPRILFHVADVVLKPDYMSVVSAPANRARQVSDILDATKDLRERWDAAAESRGLSFDQGSSGFAELGLVRRIDLRSLAKVSATRRRVYWANTLARSR